jgi:hypothetical protein
MGPQTVKDGVTIVLVSESMGTQYFHVPIQLSRTNGDTQTLKTVRDFDSYYVA